METQPNNLMKKATTYVKPLATTEVVVFLMSPETVEETQITVREYFFPHRLHYLETFSPFRVFVGAKVWTHAENASINFCKNSRVPSLTSEPPASNSAVAFPI